MLTQEELAEFFKDKNVEWTVFNTIKIKSKNSLHEHHFPYPENLEQLQTYFNTARNELLFAQGRVQRSIEPVNQNQSPKELVKNECCGKSESTKTIGAGSAIKAVLSGRVTEEIIKARLEACHNCQIKDIDGERLYRIDTGMPFCGIPRLSDIKKIKRCERDYGCGCNLKVKTRYKISICPFGVW